MALSFDAQLSREVDAHFAEEDEPAREYPAHALLRVTVNVPGPTKAGVDHEWLINAYVEHGVVRFGRVFRMERGVGIDGGDFAEWAARFGFGDTDIAWLKRQAIKEAK